MKVQVGDKVWDKEAIQTLIDEDDIAVARALMVVYGYQTKDEKLAHGTRHANGMGFCRDDAKPLTDIAEKWKIWGRWASKKQADFVRRRIRKYHRQILQHMLETKPNARLVDCAAPATQHPADSMSVDPKRIQLAYEGRF